MFLVLIDDILHHKTQDITLIFNILSILQSYFLSPNLIISFLQVLARFTQKSGFILRFSSNKTISIHLFSTSYFHLKKQ